MECCLSDNAWDASEEENEDTEVDFLTIPRKNQQREYRETMGMFVCLYVDGMGIEWEMRRKLKSIGIGSRLFV